MSATQEDYAYVYDHTLVSITTTLARKFVTAINTVLTDLTKPHFWEVHEHKTVPPEARSSILIKNTSNGNDRWIRIKEVGDFELEVKSSDIGPPVGDWMDDLNWPVGSSPDNHNIFLAGSFQLYITPGNATGKVFFVEYVDAFGIINEGKNAGGGWRYGAIIGKVINTLNKSDGQHWNGNAEVVGSPFAGTSKGGFNGEGIITGVVSHYTNSVGWLQGQSDLSIVRTDVDVWTPFNTDYDYQIGTPTVDYNVNGTFTNTAPLHLQINNTERLIPYPVVSKINDSLLGFTRYHRSFEFMTSHGTLIKSTDPLSKQAWFMYRSNTATANPAKNNTCILWNKDESVTVP